MLGLGVGHDRRLGQCHVLVLVPDPRRRADFVSATATDSSGNTSEFSHDFGKDTPPTARHELHHPDGRRGRAGPFDGTARSIPRATRSPTPGRSATAATATGATPIHTYRAAGTFTVILTVNDGFGGISTATATITVNRRAAGVRPSRSRRR